MTVEFKHITYNEPVTNEDQRYMLIKKRNYSAYYPTKSAFIYDIRSYTIYDAILWESYRWTIHENIFSFHGFHFNDIEPENFIRFVFITDGCYNAKGQFLDKYDYNELGIPGLSYAWMYYEGYKELQKRADKLKSYDLDIIESYVEYLKNEQATIRQTEINLNLPKVHDRRNKRKFNITK
ncbi:hypothetical protein J6N69_05235 [bacterium]|nr:hypothetical protein [bacterium]